MLQDDVLSLRQIPMFKDVDMAKLKLLALASRRVSYLAGDIMLKQGSPANTICVIIAGEFELRREQEGMTLVLTTLGAGTMIGELGVVLDEPYTSTVAAIMESTVLEIDRAVFLELLLQIPQFSMALIRELARRVLWASNLYTKALKDRNNG